MRRATMRRRARAEERRARATRLGRARLPEARKDHMFASSLSLGCLFNVSYLDVEIEDRDKRCLQALRVLRRPGPEVQDLGRVEVLDALAAAGHEEPLLGGRT